MRAEQFDLTVAHAERNLAALDRERVLAKQFAAPSLHRRNIRVVGSRDFFEIFRIRDQLLGDAVAGGGSLQQNPEQVDNGKCLGGGGRAPLDAGKLCMVAGESALDRLKNRRPARGFGEAAMELTSVRTIH